MFHISLELTSEEPVYTLQPAASCAARLCLASPKMSDSYSLQETICYYCDKKLLRKNLKEHTKRRHKENLKPREKLSQNQSSLFATVKGKEESEAETSSKRARMMMKLKVYLLKTVTKWMTHLKPQMTWRNKL